MDQGSGVYSKLPYMESLLNYASKKIVPFQCPGHKAGKAYKKKYRELISGNLFRIETNEIGIIDTFQNPQKSLKLSQELMAKAYGVYKTYYISGGSTLSNHIAIISSVSDGDNIVIPRNSHKSIFSAVILSGARPVFIYPGYDYQFNIDYNVSFEDVRKVVESQKISAVVICHPTYYGLKTDVEEISEYLDSRGVLLIVDQAWGAHFKFNPNFPTCSTDTKAHIIVMSPHKTLFAFTQSSILNLNHSLVNRFPELVAKIHQTVLMLNSTSPSSLLFLSLDYTQYMLNNDLTIFEKMYKLSEYTIRKIRDIDPSIVFNNHDITKVVINLSKYGISGYELEEVLLEKYRIQVEMSDLFNAILLITVGDTKSKIDYFLRSLKEIIRELKLGFLKPKGIIRKIQEYPDWPELVLSPRQAYISKTKEVPIKESYGKISAEIITTYPPGIPILIPGERITKQIADYIECEIDYGTKITGIYNIKERKIRVVDE
ncbi:MAG: aminotransferase class V-fold PLP-dependent enzyme [Candidatus Calescibacterium sp.]|nr:aminotransferase class V-fold PLP-dependent enzyme [Candidatus Calescibacterium sp.]MCX7972567.1 aminotransferase class V-fold PLP-dependent enzyme [bacterium]MDW8195798.1 aminotransferase class V-fold PLP-dependent enzyme [Candidatus Calescibacterium sp.]